MKRFFHAFSPEVYEVEEKNLRLSVSGAISLGKIFFFNPKKSFSIHSWVLTKSRSCSALKRLDCSIRRTSHRKKSSFWSLSARERETQFQNSIGKRRDESSLQILPLCFFLAFACQLFFSIQKSTRAWKPRERGRRIESKFDLNLNTVAHCETIKSRGDKNTIISWICEQKKIIHLLSLEKLYLCEQIDLNW